MINRRQNNQQKDRSELYKEATDKKAASSSSVNQNQEETEWKKRHPLSFLATIVSDLNGYKEAEKTLKCRQAKDIYTVHNPQSYHNVALYKAQRRAWS